ELHLHQHAHRQQVQVGVDPVTHANMQSEATTAVMNARAETAAVFGEAEAVILSLRSENQQLGAQAAAIQGESYAAIQALRSENQQLGSRASVIQGEAETVIGNLRTENQQLGEMNRELNQRLEKQAKMILEQQELSKAMHQQLIALQSHVQAAEPKNPSIPPSAIPASSTQNGADQAASAFNALQALAGEVGGTMRRIEQAIEASGSSGSIAPGPVEFGLPAYQCSRKSIFTGRLHSATPAPPPPPPQKLKPQVFDIADEDDFDEHGEDEGDEDGEDFEDDPIVPVAAHEPEDDRDYESSIYKYKDLKDIKLPQIPGSSVEFRAYRNSVLTQIASIDCSGKAVLLKWLQKSLDPSGSIALTRCHASGTMPSGRALLSILSRRYRIDKVRGPLVTLQSLFDLEPDSFSYQSLVAFKQRVEYVLNGLPERQWPDAETMFSWIYSRLKGCRMLSRTIDRVKDAKPGSKRRTFEYIWNGLEEVLAEVREDRNEQALKDSLKEDSKQKPKPDANAKAAAAKATPESPTPIVVPVRVPTGTKAKVKGKVDDYVPVFREQIRFGGDGLHREGSGADDEGDEDAPTEAQRLITEAQTRYAKCDDELDPVEEHQQHLVFSQVGGSIAAISVPREEIHVPRGNPILPMFTAAEAALSSFTKAEYEAIEFLDVPFSTVAPSTPAAKRHEYITLDRLMRLGATPGCKACKFDGTVHTPVCKARFDDLIKAEKIAASKSVRDAAPPDVERPDPSAESAPAAPEGDEDAPERARVLVQPEWIDFASKHELSSVACVSGNKATTIASNSKRVLEHFAKVPTKDSPGINATNIEAYEFADLVIQSLFPQRYFKSVPNLGKASALITKNLSRREWQAEPKALEAIAQEAEGLRRNGTWDDTTAMPLHELRSQARSQGGKESQEFPSNWFFEYKITGTTPDKLRRVTTPCIAESSMTDEDISAQGELHDSASRILMRCLWLARLCRADIAFAVTRLASRVTRWTAWEDRQVLRLVSYIHHTRDVCMNASCSWDAAPELRVYTDADFAACPYTSRSTSGIVVHIGTGQHAFPVMWQSRKQTSVARSTPEAEMISMASAMFSEVINLQTFLQSAFKSTVPIIFFQDNETVLAILKSGYSPKLRHLGRVHRVNVASMAEIFEQEDFSATYVNSKEQLANGLTKIIPPAEWSDMLTQLCLHEGVPHNATVSKVVVEEAERFASSLPRKITQEDLVQLLSYLPGESAVRPSASEAMCFTTGAFAHGGYLEIGLFPGPEVPFWCEKTVPIGIRDASGAYIINPEKSYKVKMDDEVIVLAEDDDAIQRMPEPMMDFQAWRNKYGASTFVEADPNDNEKVQVLICNFTERGYGCAILFALDEMVAPGSVCDIFCSLTEEDARAIVSNAEEEQDRRLKNIEVRRIYTTAQHQMTAQHKLNTMPLQDYDFHFILADSALGFQKADEQTVAIILQMKMLLKARAPDLEFNPLVEICTNNAHAQLGLLGIENTINTISMMSRAMALVAIDTLAHGVLSDLLSATGNNMDIMTLRDYLGQQRLPSQISFAEITAMVNRAAQQVVIGWSERDSYGNKVWVVNPKEKLQPRVWTEEDRIVVIKDV
ncbi:unnamed protein product, partial [Symbiodinium sp. CCMP2592]